MDWGTRSGDRQRIGYNNSALVVASGCVARARKRTTESATRLYVVLIGNRGQSHAALGYLWRSYEIRGLIGVEVNSGGSRSRFYFDRFARAR